VAAAEVTRFCVLVVAHADSNSSAISMLMRRAVLDTQGVLIMRLL
jgi:hypothetical protein